MISMHSLMHIHVGLVFLCMQVLKRIEVLVGNRLDLTDPRYFLQFQKADTECLQSAGTGKRISRAK